MASSQPAGDTVAGLTERATVTTPLRVLILEDRAADAELMLHELRRAGFDPDWRRVETEADYLAHLDPALDLILADYNLPQFDAVRALHLVHERRLDIPFIIVSGSIGEDVAVECMKNGASDYVLKDRLTRLGRAVANALEQKKLRDEQKRAEEALQAAKEYAETLIHSSLNMIVSVDANRNIVEFNRAAEETFGYSKAEVLGQPVDLLYADPSDEASRVSSAILKHGGFTGEIRNRRKNGEIFCSYLSASVVRDANGKIVGGMGISWDITERKRAEEGRQALYRASLEVLEPLPLRARLDRLLATARDVLKVDRLNILLADSKGKWLQAVASLGTKEPLEAILVPIGPAGGAIAQAYLTKRAVFWDGVGPVPEELRLKPPYDRIEAFRSRVFANVPLVVQGRAIGVLGADRKHTRRSLEPATRELLQLFAAQAGIAIEHARLYEDLRFAAIQLEAKVEARTRELQAANLRLEEASRFKSEFLASMSHELRTPLNSIIGFSELLEDQQFGPLNEKQERYMHNIWTSGRHLLDLINDILDLSKVEAGKIELHMETFSLREALGAALTMVRPQAAKKRISLRSEIVAETTVTADPLRFKQIMYNLLSNAIKFTPEGGQVSVAARTVEDAFVEIAVTDTGIGIKAEDVPRLFQEFMQLDSFLGKQHEGTGLGLALTKRLVELHGGKIWAESLGPGQGTTVTLTLPITAPTSSVTS